MVYNLIQTIIILSISFFVLIKSADYLILSSSEIGRRFGISKFIIGLTIVAIGTSLPELFTSLIALFSVKNPSDFVLGTVIGSNIANILLVFGILLIFSKKFKVELKNFDIIFFILSLSFLILIILREKINFFLGIILFTSFIIYILINLKKGSKKEFNKEIKEIEETEDIFLKNKHTIYLFLILVFSLIGLNYSSNGVVFGIKNLGQILLIPVKFLTLTTVALATSLPEMIVSYSSAKKGEFDLAVGNIIGSNISNILLIIGVVGILKPILFISKGYFFSLFILTLASLFFIFLTNKNKVNKNYGYFLLVLYLLYVIILF